MFLCYLSTHWHSCPGRSGTRKTWCSLQQLLLSPLHWRRPGGRSCPSALKGWRRWEQRGWSEPSSSRRVRSHTCSSHAGLKSFIAISSSLQANITFRRSVNLYDSPEYWNTALIKIKRSKGLIKRIIFNNCPIDIVWLYYFFLHINKNPIAERNFKS